MNIFKTSLKLIVQIFFVIIFFSTLHARNLDKLNNGDDISNYFSGILLLDDSEYLDSYKLLKQLNGLEESHINYSKKYIYALVSLGRISEAYTYSKKLEKKNLDNFESNLITGIYYVKNKKPDLARKYFLKIKERKSSFVVNTFLSNSLLNWVNFNQLDFKNAQVKIKSLDSRFENLKKIQEVFSHCYYQSDKTDFFFRELTSNNKINFSRYNYFHALYLTNSNNIEQANKVIDSSLKKYPRNVLLSQYKLDLRKKNFRNYIFDCKNSSHVMAEILYITANALSAQSLYQFSNFYLNLAKYLNKNFYSFDSLLAENFFNVDKSNKSKKIYNELKKNGSAFLWHSSRQQAKILIKEGNSEKAIKLISDVFKKLPEKNIYHIFDYAEFLKNNEQFENSIKFYTSVLEQIEKKHSLYPAVMDGRGIAYERIGKWDSAEKDLLNSLEADPEQAYVINYLAYSWIEKGIKIKKSLEMLEKANNLKENDPYIIDSLGWALYKLKKYKKSKNYLQVAVQLMPGDPIVNDHYADSLWQNGDKIQARYYWNYVLQLENSKEELKNNIKNKLISGL